MGTRCCELSAPRWQNARQTSLFDRLLYWPNIAWASSPTSFVSFYFLIILFCAVQLTHLFRLIISVMCTVVYIRSVGNRVHHFRSVGIGTRPSPEFSPQLRDKIWQWPRDESRYLLVMITLQIVHKYSSVNSGPSP